MTTTLLNAVKRLQISCRKCFLLLFALLLTGFFPNSSWAAEDPYAGIPAAPMRRPISPESPMWLIHIDTWNWADPQKIIDLIPDDIKPYAVMNISLSISHNEETGEFNIAPDGYEIAKSWLRVCAENRMWAMVQCASGGFSHFSEYDLSVYEEFYQDYPNFVGWNFAEQFWGFDDKFSCSWLERMNLFAQLMKMAHRYGGYLTVSWCSAYWGASLNPIAMMKRCPEFAAACKACPEHFILCEKFTMSSCFHEIESTCLGTWLSGYSGHYGIRFDDCGWNESFGTQFPEAAGAIPVLSHVMLTGETVIDGPELIWRHDFQELSTVRTPDGYTARRWGRFPEFENISIDIFRKILDGSIRIMDRKEVIDYSKVVIVQDVKTGDAVKDYMTPENLFKGLYQKDDDGEWLNNITWMKKTGRYPAIPAAYTLADSLAQTFEVQVKASQYAKRWPNIQSKVNEFNNLFPEEYSGDIYASRVENAWVFYNPNIKDYFATGVVPFQYNTCDRLRLALNQYSLVQMRENEKDLSLYLTNYRNDDTSLRADTLYIYGAEEKPTYTYKDRASHQPTQVSEDWNAGVYRLVVKHHGPVDLSIACHGSAQGRRPMTGVTPSQITRPQAPSVYCGPRQRELECFDYKNIDRCWTNGVSSSIKGYTGQGFVSVGKAAGVGLRDSVSVNKTGFYQLKLRYYAPNGAVQNLSLNVNGSRVTTMNLSKSKTGETWKTFSRKIKLNAGMNEISFATTKAGTNNLYLDNIVIAASDGDIYNFTGDKAGDASAISRPEMITLRSGSLGVEKVTDETVGVSDNMLCPYTDEALPGVADLDLFPIDATDYVIGWRTVFASDNASVGLLMRAGAEVDEKSGRKCGYLMNARRTADDKLEIGLYHSSAEGIVPMGATYTSSFTLKDAASVWCRAFAYGDSLWMECSQDSMTWEGGLQTAWIDKTYRRGATQWIWGHNGETTGWYADNIILLQPRLAVNHTSLTGLQNFYGSTETGDVQEFVVAGEDLVSDVVLDVTGEYEISLDAASGYSDQLILPQSDGTPTQQTIYVRLKSGLELADYTGLITISTALLPMRTIALSGATVPQRVSLIYDFESDNATPSYTTPPAKDISVGVGNGSRAGVFNYTDASGATGHWLRTYGGGPRNGTGILNLNRFTHKATDYSVTWRQANGTTSDYKVGVLLRGNKSKIGTASSGYVQGMMHGYVFIVYNTSDRTEFRIYNSSASTSLTMLSNASASLTPAVGDVVWYRASVSGASVVNLKLEYSTDEGKTWLTGGVFTDNQGLYKQGSSQIVWGLAASVKDFYMDDIAFEGITYDESVLNSIGSVAQDAECLSEEYYDLTGRRVAPGEEMKGIYILRRYFSDRHVESRKVVF